MRAGMLGSAAIVSCAALVGFGAAGALGAATTNVTIKGQNGEFRGKIRSSEESCLGGRKVIVYRLEGNGYDPRHDEKIGSDTSKRHRDVGKWSVGNTGETEGAFYALAKRSPGCKKAASLPVTP